MTHERSRLAVSRIRKRLDFYSVVALQGARQVGKSYLVRNLLFPKKKESKFFTFDDVTLRAQVEASPQAFLEDNEAKPLIVDEAQKVPEIFEAIKLFVDRKKVPGRYLLLGSTEFSQLIRIRESLAGRMGRVRVFPMTLFESLWKTSAKPTLDRRKLMVYLENGGMPGIFAVRDRSQWHDLYSDWLSLTVERDIFQTGFKNLDKNVALGCLKCLSTLKVPSLSEISKELRKSSRIVSKHLEALQALFIVQKLDAHPKSKSRSPWFLPFEVGLAGFLGASLERRLHVFLMNERLVALHEKEKNPFQFWHYVSHSGNLIHWVEDAEEKACYQLVNFENFKQQELELLRVFSQEQGYRAHFLQPGSTQLKIKGIQIAPWQTVAQVW